MRFLSTRIAFTAITTAMISHALGSAAPSDCGALEVSCKVMYKGRQSSGDFIDTVQIKAFSLNPYQTQDGEWSREGKLFKVDKKVDLIVEAFQNLPSDENSCNFSMRLFKASEDYELDWNTVFGNDRNLIGSLDAPLANTDKSFGYLMVAPTKMKLHGQQLQDIRVLCTVSGARPSN